MTDTTHPSDEQLTAFFDRQLPEHKLQTIREHVGGCADCGAVLSDFAVLQELGPVVEESMPSDLYWEDLPDRVLARIASGALAGIAAEDLDPALAPAAADAQPAPAPASRGWWRSLWTPAVRWSAATAMVAVAGIAVINTLGDDTPGADVASVDPAPGDPAPGEADPGDADPGDAPPAVTPASMAPDEYAERIAHTLARDGNLGTQLDGTAGRASGGLVGYSPIQTVSLGLMDSGAAMAPEPERAPAAAQPVERSLPPRNPEWYFLTALRAEARGKCDLAQAGYQLARTQTSPQDPIHIASEAGLTRCAWRTAIAQSGNRSAETLGQLRTKAEERFAEHAAGRHQDCVKAWELWVSYLELGKDAMTAQEYQEGRARLRSLSACVE